MCMKKYLLLILSLYILSSLQASDLADRYIMKVIENGQLYFILPYNIPSKSAKEKALSVDITYLTTSDSTTINMSVWTKNELAIDSIVFVGRENWRIEDFSIFFIEKDGKLWLHRYSLRFPFCQLVQLYKEPDPFVLCFYAKGDVLQYSCSLRSWSKEQLWMNQILHTIMSNKKIYE